MNHNLVALHEDLNMLDRFSGQDAAAKVARHRAQEIRDSTHWPSVRSDIHQTEEEVLALLFGPQATVGHDADRSVRFPHLRGRRHLSATAQQRGARPTAWPVPV